MSYRRTRELTVLCVLWHCVSGTKY